MAGDGSIERELKVEVPATFTVPSFEGFDALTAGGSRVALHAVYWDTAALTLTAWGHTLRARHADDGSEHGWTLKLADDGAGIAVRRELNLPGHLETPPPAALDIVRGLIGHQPVLPVATIVTERHRQALRHLASGATVELDDDRVTSIVSGEVGPSFRELEVEVLEGDPGVLDHAATLLHDAGAGRPDPAPKLWRVLAERVPASPLHNGETPRTAGDLVGAAIANSARQLLRHDPIIRLNGDVEAVHQARVATRRLRSNLKTLGPLLEPFRVDGLRREVAWLGAMLGRVRDRDVLATTLARHAEHVAGRDDAAIERLLAHLRAERALQLDVLLDVMCSSRYHGLIADLTRLAGDPPLSAEHRVAAKAKPAARQLAGAAFNRLERKVRRLPSHPPAAELHEVRKAAKQARYAAELVAPLAKGKTDRLARSLGKLQDRLGDKQDDATLADWLIDLPLDDLGTATAFAAGQLAQEIARSAAEAPTDWHPAWATVRAAHQRSWLG